jgi:hypothetical protein
MKHEYARLRALPGLDEGESARLAELAQALKDLPDWNAVPERDVRQQQLLGEIRSALEKHAVARPPARRPTRSRPRKAAAKKRRKRSR